MIKALEDARAEIMRTIDDLRKDTPGLQCSVLITAPISHQDSEATFFTSADIHFAVASMLRVMREIGAQETQAKEKTH